MTRTTALFLSVFLSTLTVQSAVSLGPEIPVGAANLVPAAYRQIHPIAASNGRGFLVSWSDDRSSSPPFFAELAHYTSRLDLAGQPVNPLGRRLNLSRDGEPALASNGDGYLLAYRTAGGVFTIKLDDNGEPRSTPVLISTTTGKLALSSNGSSYLLTVAQSSPAPTTTVFLLDGDGGPGKIFAISGVAEPAAVTSLSNEYHILTAVAEECGPKHPCTSMIKHYRITGSGGLEELEPVATRLSSNTEVAAAAGTDRLLVNITSVSNDGSAMVSTDVVALEANGQRIGTVTRLDRSPATLDITQAAPFVAFDGVEFLAGSWVNTTSSYPPRFSARAIRLRSDGTPLDSQPFTLSSNDDSFSLAFASTGPTQLIAWTDTSRSRYGNLVSRTVSRFAELAAPSPQNVIAFSAPPQFEPSVVDLGNRVFCAWSQLDSHQEIRGEFLRNGATSAETEVLISPSGGPDQVAPAVGVGATSMIVIWSEVHLDDPVQSRVVARRVDFAGKALDAEPIVVANGDAAGSISVTFDGSQFLAVWTNGGDVHAARIAPNGFVLDRTPIVVSRRPYGTPMSPRVMWTGQSFLVAWFEYISGFVVPSLPLETAIRLTRVTTTGEVVDVMDTPVLSLGIGATVKLDADYENGIAVIVWRQSDGRQECVNSLVVTADGSPLQREPVAIECTTSFINFRVIGGLALARAGAGRLVFRIDDSDGVTSLLASALDASGAPKGGTFLVAQPANLFAVTAASATNRTVLAYNRIASDTSAGDVARVFVRTADPTPIVRRRAVR